MCGRSRSRGRKKCVDLSSCTCGSSGGGTKGCEQKSTILVGKEEEVEEEKGGESVSEKAENDTDVEEEEEEEEESVNDKEDKEVDAEENNNDEEGLGNNLVPKEMMSFHPTMEDLVELISDSGVMLNQHLRSNKKLKSKLFR